jgi:hypothetical protein
VGVVAVVVMVVVGGRGGKMWRLGSAHDHSTERTHAASSAPGVLGDVPVSIARSRRLEDSVSASFACLNLVSASVWYAYYTEWEGHITLSMSRTSKPARCRSNDPVSVYTVYTVKTPTLATPSLLSSPLQPAYALQPALIPRSSHTLTHKGVFCGRRRRRRRRRRRSRRCVCPKTSILKAEAPHQLGS